MKTIYLVRHGEAENNVQTSTRFQGPTASLTELGRRQAEMIAERAVRLPVEVLIASTMVRAHETALRISGRINKPVESSDLFIERRAPSILTGMRRDDPEYLQLRDDWEKTFTGAEGKVHDGENFADLRERAQKAFAYLERRPESHILVVTHGVFLRMLAAYMLFTESLTPQQYEAFIPVMRMQNTGLTVFKYDDKAERYPWHLWIWNDHAHLG